MSSSTESTANLTPAEDVAALPVSVLRYATAWVLSVAALAYLAAIVLGYIPPDRRLDTTALLCILLVEVTIVMLIYPYVLRHVESLGAGSFHLELEQIKREQDMQRSQVNAIAAVLPLMMTEAERKLLLELGREVWKGLEASQEVRDQLRHLRDMRLIQMRRKGDTIHGIPNGPVELLDYVKLTEIGNNFWKELQRLDSERTGIARAPTS